MWLCYGVHITVWHSLSYPIFLLRNIFMETCTYSHACTNHLEGKFTSGVLNVNMTFRLLVSFWTTMKHLFTSFFLYLPSCLFLQRVFLFFMTLCLTLAISLTFSCLLGMPMYKAKPMSARANGCYRLSDM